VYRVICEGRIWFRCYQITDEWIPELGQSKRVLLESGPRFVMTTIRIFSGSFGGPVLYDNPDFVSPNEVRAMLQRKNMVKYEDRQLANELRGSKIEKMPPDELDDVFVEGDL